MKTLKLSSILGLFFVAHILSCNGKPKDTDPSSTNVTDSYSTKDSLSVKGSKRDSSKTMRDTFVPSPLGVPGADRNNPDITK